MMETKQDGTRPVLRVDEAARLLGVSRHTIYEAVKLGQIPSLRLGRIILIPRAALEVMLTNLPTP